MKKLLNKLKGKFGSNYIKSNEDHLPKNKQSDGFEKPIEQIDAYKIDAYKVEIDNYNGGYDIVFDTSSDIQTLKTYREYEIETGVGLGTQISYTENINSNIYNTLSCNTLGEILDKMNKDYKIKQYKSRPKYNHKLIIIDHE